MNEFSEVQGPNTTGNADSGKTFDSISRTVKLFGDKQEIEKVFKPFVKTGIAEIDKMLGGGFAPGRVVLGAISNLGKSTWALQLAESIVKNGTPVMFFSYEMSAEWIAAKLISRRTFIDSGKDERKAVMAKELLNKETVYSEAFKPKWETVKNAVTSIAEELQDLYIIDAKSEEFKHAHLTAERICSKVQSFIAEHHKKPFVIIDYLQIIPMEEARFSDIQSIDHNIEVLSTIDKDITVLMISSFNRNSYNEPMKLSSFKGSGTIEYSADVILGLDFTKLYENAKAFNIDEEKEKTPRKIQTMAIKQRYNASGRDTIVKLDYYSAYDYFEIIHEDQKKKTNEEKSRQRTGNSGESNNRRDNPGTGRSRAGGTVDFFMYCKSKEEVKTLYRKLSKLYHPDMNEETEGELFKIINAQYEIKMKQFESAKG